MKLLLVVFLFLSGQSFANQNCADFTGVYFFSGPTEPFYRCSQLRQTDCSQLEMHAFGGGLADYSITIITDGTLHDAGAFTYNANMFLTMFTFTRPPSYDSTSLIMSLIRTGDIDVTERYLNHSGIEHSLHYIYEKFDSVEACLKAHP